MHWRVGPSMRRHCLSVSRKPAPSGCLGPVVRFPSGGLVYLFVTTGIFFMERNVMLGSYSISSCPSSMSG